MGTINQAEVELARIVPLQPIDTLNPNVATVVQTTKPAVLYAPVVSEGNFGLSVLRITVLTGGSSYYFDTYKFITTIAAYLGIASA